MLGPQQPPPILRISPLAARAGKGELCSNLNYKPPVESRQKHFALYVDRQLHSVAIMIEEIGHHKECTHFKSDHSRMSIVEPQNISKTIM